MVNLSNYILQLNKKIISTTDEKELLMLKVAVEKIKLGIVYTVRIFSQLPTTANYGELYLVKDEGIIYFKYSFQGYEQWIPIITLEVNQLWTWGDNASGQLGDGTAIDRYSPGTTAGGGTTWCQVSSGNNHTAAIKTDGTLWTWGSNGSGRLGDGTTVSRFSPGTVAGEGTNWCQVCAGGTGSSAAIKTDGTLWTWGYNTRGQLGDGTTVSRCSPGTVAGGGTNWCQVSGAFGHTAAIKTDGTLWTWGCNLTGRLGDGTEVSRCSPGTIAGGGTTWYRVSSGNVHTAAIKTDGTLWTWGANCQGLLGDGTTVSRCSPGTVFGGGTTWCQVSGARYHMASIKTDGTLWTWGRNSNGQLGNGIIVDRCSPGTIAGEGTTWCQVSIASLNAAAVKTDGTLWTWGFNSQGRLGDGTTVTRCSPGTTSGGGTNWCQVSILETQAVAILRSTI